jgi:tetratricopeptide (TPR) repeat protein
MTALSRIAGSVKCIALILISAAELFGLPRSDNQPQPPSTQVPAAQKPEENSNSRLRNVKEWRTAIGQHIPGRADAAAAKIASFRAKDVEYILDFVTKMASMPAKSARRELAKGPIRRLLDPTDQEVREGNLSRILKQGVLLHTDIALLGLEKTGFKDTRELVGVFEDGRVAIQPKRLHWTFARRLIESLSQASAQSPMVRQWYIATTAQMQSRRLLAYADDNLKCALKLFPLDDRLLFYAGVLHEIWASSSNQNIQLPLMDKVFYGSREKELKLAHQFFEKAVTVNPGFAEAHLHLGRVTGLLGDHHKALAELQKAAATLGDPQLLYYASLYLGCEFEALSQPGEARDQYEHAAVLYPTAQSPLFALSQLAHSTGDPEGALAALQRVFALQPGKRPNGDPWWNYDLSHVREADALVSGMYKAFGELSQ